MKTKIISVLLLSLSPLLAESDFADYLDIRPPLKVDESETPIRRNPFSRQHIVIPESSHADIISVEAEKMANDARAWLFPLLDTARGLFLPVKLPADFAIILETGMVLRTGEVFDDGLFTVTIGQANEDGLYFSVVGQNKAISAAEIRYEGDTWRVR